MALTRGIAAAAAVVVMAALTAPAALAADDDPAPSTGLIGEYLFTQDEGQIVSNTVAGAGALGDATVVNGDDGNWTGNSLSFTGGVKSSNANWVRLPEDVLAGKTSATIVTEAKIDASMKSTYNFLWNVGNDASESYFFATVRDAPRTAITTSSNGGEANARSGSNLSADRWYSIASVIDGEAGTITFFIDGVQVGQTTTSLTPASIADQSLNAIGRSPWPDPFFKGEVTTFRVYDVALGVDQVKAISLADAKVHSSEIAGYARAVLDGLSITDAVVNDEYVPLPTADGAVSWRSSNPDVVTSSGAVTQPSPGSAPIIVEMTATATVRGERATQSIALTVNPTTKTDLERVAGAAAGYVIPQVIISGSALPVPAFGTAVDFQNPTGFSVSPSGVVTIAGPDSVTGTVESVVSKSGITGLDVRKTFTVKVLPAGSKELVSYHRTPTSEAEANNADIALSMHLAVKSASDDTWVPLNENYGIFFAKTSQTPPADGPSEGLLRTLKNPAIFTMKDGSYGVVATRTARAGGSDGTGKSSVLVATSKDLLAYHEGALIDLGETNGVNSPFAVYDSASDRYVIAWTDDSGVPKFRTLTTMADGDGETMLGSIAQSGFVSDASGIANFTAGRSVAIDEPTAIALDHRFGRISNTGYRQYSDVSIPKGTDVASIALPETVALEYSDASTGSLPIENWDTAAIDTAVPGTYAATGTVKQTQYPVPFADERADPSIVKYDWNGTIKYLMIATNDWRGANIDQQGAAKMPIRVADSILELSDASGATEVDLLRRGDTDADGGVMTGCFWAPEYHVINGRLSILFMPCYGSSPNMWTGRASIMQLKQDPAGNDLDPAVPANWTKPERVLRADGTDLNQAAGISLDMTFFTDLAGQSYYSWQQLGANYIAKMDPADPTRLTSEPVRIVVPEYSWDNMIAEGPNVIVRNGTFYMIYSGSMVGNSYTTGLAMADASGNTDVTDPAAWTKLNYPIQKSGIYNGSWQLGTGHGMWSEDEDGNVIYVFHARTDNNGLPGRDMFVRRVHWSAEGLPIFDMEPSEELATSTRAANTVTINVVVEAEAVVIDRQFLSEEVAGAGALVESDYTPETWAPFALALEAARGVLADPDPTQAAVDDSLAALISARAALVKVNPVLPVTPVPPAIAVPPATVAPQAQVALTGAEAMGLIAAAFAMLVGGVVLTAMRRRRA